MKNNSEENIVFIKKLLNKLICFKEIKSEKIDEIANNSDLKSIKIGYPIIYPKSIPSSIIIIIEGEARLISEEASTPITVAKYGVGSILGLGSILRTFGCESINASSQVKALSIPDHLILKLYKEEKSFRILFAL